MQRKNLVATIIGTGSYLPNKILSNADLEKMVETSDEWIVTRTGVKERRIASSEEFSSTMGKEAALRAIQDAKIDSKEIDCIIVATLTPDYVFPSTACLIQSELKLKDIPAFDMQAACSGFIYGISMAKAFVESGTYNNVLVVATEKLSSIVNYQDRTTCVLFGDGSSACVVSSQNREGLEIKSVVLGADGEQSDLLMLPAGGCRNPASIKTVEQGMHYIKMNGKETFKHAVRRMETASIESLKRAQISESDVSYLIPHQANMRIIEAIAKRFTHLSEDRVYKKGVVKYGNTSASTIGIALDEIRKEKTIHEKENILLTAFGAGLTWGAAVLTQRKGIHE